METLRVALGDRSYPIHIGRDILGREDLYGSLSGRAVTIATNRVVAPRYLEPVRQAIERAGGKAGAVVLEDGEQAKCWQNVDRICDALLASRVGRDGLLVALGGGVIGDLAGFAAAVYQRGIDFLQVPTTLLAQVDSSVGGKTAINHARGKNMIGAFHQPVGVVSDVATLDTLPDRELRAGLAEVIKHAAALDAAFFDWLELNVSRLVQRDRDALVHAIRRCCELKADVVAEDEREAGRRALLNFGHTFGHAIELAAGYGSWLHGEAVAAGMVMGAELSRRLGLVPAEGVERLRLLIREAGLPVKGPSMDPERLMELMSTDKKAAQGRVRFVVLESLGRASLRGGVAPELVSEAIRSSS